MARGARPYMGSGAVGVDQNRLGGRYTIRTGCLPMITKESAN